MEKHGLFLGSVALAAGLVLAAYIGTQGLLQFKSQEQTISVTGSAKRRIHSDLIIWRASVSSRASRVIDGYQQLAKSIPVVTAYLQKKGVPQNQIVVSAVSINKLHGRDKDGHELAEVITGYELEQTVEVRSPEVDKVTQVSREITELINQGIELESETPQYLYTKLGELKIQMLAEASKDAKVRAEQIASSTGSRIGKLRSARMGVMQIMAADASEISDTGANDTAAIDKDIMAVVASSFALE